MQINSHADEIRQAYSTDDVSDMYIEKRFTSPIGRILHEAQVKFVSDTINRYNIETVLEIAPGPARITVDVGRICNRTAGTIVDFNTNMLRLARMRLHEAGVGSRWRTVAGDAFALPLTDSFPMAYSFRFIRHFHSADRKRLYRQIRDRLTDDGLLVFDAVNHEVSHPLRIKASEAEYPIYDKLYTIPELRQELEENGFRLLQYVPVQKHYNLQGKVQALLRTRAPAAAYFLLRAIESVSIGKPLEWLVLCQKK